MAGLGASNKVQPQEVLLNNQFRLPMLINDSFADWREKALLTLGCMDLDLAIHVDESATLLDFSTPKEKAHYERWERSNRLSLMLIKANDYLKAIEDQFVSSKKALASTLMGQLCSLKYSGGKGVHEHIMRMRDKAA
ncbi:uncharacterized protein LOC122646226 [Telopea speciosissima]|uniref:uncharacterized protein LOC122646226 n=1 Tax=Telopea speciosissima TaxID=54955 RepID=UPI001CC47612|nr:uncharacterized protein LOC122646226 [Telopea speciosissima]